MVRSSLLRTSAMASRGVADHIWTLTEIERLAD